VIETAPRPTIRTIVASFLFTDLVGFSKGTAAEQYAAKAELSAALRRHLAPLRESDYWIKDTGDGALIAFVSNPEHALYMALALGRDYGDGGGAQPSARLRTGLHLGTVKESVDVEARRNFIGDGINAAKRIMDFAPPGQIAASRAFFEAIANLDAAYAALFRHAGAPDDKHGRSHELYEVALSDSVLAKLRSDIAAEQGEASGADSPTASRPAGEARGASGRYKRYAALIGIALALAIVALGMRESSQPGNAPQASSAAPAGAQPMVQGGAQPSLAPPSAAATLGPEESRPAPEPSKPATPLPESEHLIDRGEAKAGPTRTQTAAPAPPMRGANERTRTTTRPSAEAIAPSVPNPRCSRIVEKAALGEPLTPDEKKELATTCR
jgi:class 3 adenylate cyclase